jgi:hypothetical protein
LTDPAPDFARVSHVRRERSEIMDEENDIAVRLASLEVRLVCLSQRFTDVNKELQVVFLNLREDPDETRARQLLVSVRHAIVSLLDAFGYPAVEDEAFLSVRQVLHGLPRAGQLLRPMQELTSILKETTDLFNSLLNERAVTSILPPPQDAISVSHAPPPTGESGEYSIAPSALTCKNEKLQRIIKRLSSMPPPQCDAALDDILHLFLASGDQ